MYKFIKNDPNNEEFLDFLNPDGSENSNPILIKLEKNDNYLDFENFVVTLKAISLGKQLNVKQKELKLLEGRYYDILYIEELLISENSVKFNLIFDVTECLGNNYDFIRNHIKCPICGGQADADGDVVHKSIQCYFNRLNEKQSVFTNENSKNSDVNLFPDESKSLQTLSFNADDIPRSFASYEHLVIKLLELINGKKYEIIKQEIIAKNGKHYDVLIAEDQADKPNKQRMKLVFDITAQWNEVYFPS
jgi:hypothetical protein